MHCCRLAWPRWVYLVCGATKPAPHTTRGAAPAQHPCSPPPFHAHSTISPFVARLLSQSLELPGISGLHVMPLTKSARQLTLDFLADGTLPSSLGIVGGASTCNA